jgi:two-component system sensor histidine kinase UhpB
MLPNTNTYLKLNRRVIFNSIILLKIILQTCFCCCVFSAVAQQKKESRKVKTHASVFVKKINKLTHQSMGLSAINPDSALILANLALNISNNAKNDTAIGDAYNAIGWSWYCLGNRDSAEYFLLESVAHFHKAKYFVLEGKSLVNLSYVYQDGEEYIKLLNCLKKARPLMERSEDEVGLSLIDLTIGSTYGDMHLYEEGKRFILSSIAVAKNLDSLQYLVPCYSAYGYLLMQQKIYDSALYYFHINYVIGTQDKDAETIAYSSDNLGEAFQKKYLNNNCLACIDSAYSYYNEALHWFTKLNSAGNIENEYINVGSILIIKKQYAQAEKLLMQAYNYFDSIQDVKYAYNAAEQLSILYRDISDYRQAYNFNIITQKFKDSIANKNRADSISKMFAVYETEKRDRAIELLNAKSKLDKEQILKQHIVQIFSIVSIVLIIILFVVLFNRSRIKQQLKEVNIRNQLAADLHDEVGSSLSSILLLSKMAATAKHAETGNYNMLEKISSNTKEVIDKMGDIVWMMNPKYDEGSNVRDKLEQYIARIKDVASFNIHLEADEAIDALKFPMEIRKNIFLIFKEAINNTLKYADAKNIFISLNLVEKNIEMVIKDDGKGFKASEVVYGNGLDTMAMRAKNCKGNFKIQSAEGKGTSIIITIPLPHIRQKMLMN